MAKLELFAPKILRFEGGYVNDPKDRGGATNMGVTLATWRQVGYDKDADGNIDCEDIKLLSKADAVKVLRLNYWNRWKGDQVTNQSIAEILVDTRVFSAGSLHCAEKTHSSTRNINEGLYPRR